MTNPGPAENCESSELDESKKVIYISDKLGEGTEAIRNGEIGHLELLLKEFIPMAREIDRAAPKEKLKIFILELKEFNKRWKSIKAERFLNDIGYSTECYFLEELAEENIEYISAGIAFTCGIGSICLGLNAEKLNPDVGWFRHYVTSLGVFLTAGSVIGLHIYNKRTANKEEKPYTTELKLKICDTTYKINDFMYKAIPSLR